MQASPAASSASETLRTLRFGERCQAVCLGTVKRATAKASTRQAEASAKAAEAAEERNARLQTELIECRKSLKESEERLKMCEQRAEVLHDKVGAQQSVIKEVKAQLDAERAKAASAKREASAVVAAATSGALGASCGVLSGSKTPRGSAIGLVEGSSKTPRGSCSSSLSSARLAAERAAAKARMEHPEGIGAAPPRESSFLSPPAGLQVAATACRDVSGDASGDVGMHGKSFLSPRAAMQPRGPTPSRSPTCLPAPSSHGQQLPSLASADGDNDRSGSSGRGSTGSGSHGGTGGSNGSNGSARSSSLRRVDPLRCSLQLPLLPAGLKALSTRHAWGDPTNDGDIGEGEGPCVVEGGASAEASAPLMIAGDRNLGDRLLRSRATSMRGGAPEQSPVEGVDKENPSAPGKLGAAAFGPPNRYQLRAKTARGSYAGRTGVADASAAALAKRPSTAREAVRRGGGTASAGAPARWR